MTDVQKVFRCSFSQAYSSQVLLSMVSLSTHVLAGLVLNIEESMIVISHTWYNQCVVDSLIAVQVSCDKACV